MTIAENLRKFVLNSPPWVIFMLSLTFMAIGVLFLAYRLRVDSNYAQKHSLSSVQLCYRSSNFSKKAFRQAVASSQFNISLPVRLKAAQSFLNISDKYASPATTVVGLGHFYSGQMGVKGNEGRSHNWTFFLPLTPVAKPCTGARCDGEDLHTCLMLSAEEPSSLPALPQEQICSHNQTSLQSLSGVQFIYLSNIYDESVELSPRDSRTTAAGNTRKPFCVGGIQLDMQIDEMEQFVFIPLLHDTMAARIHLLYTSYFLFMTLLFLLCYAMCKGHNYHKGHRGTVAINGQAEDVTAMKRELLKL